MLYVYLIAFLFAIVKRDIFLAKGVFTVRTKHKMTGFVPVGLIESRARSECIGLGRIITEGDRLHGGAFAG